MSPQAIATELIGIALLLMIVFVDWPAVIDKARGWWAAKRGRRAPPPIHQTALAHSAPGGEVASTTVQTENKAEGSLLNESKRPP